MVRRVGTGAVARGYLCAGRGYGILYFEVVIDLTVSVGRADLVNQKAGYPEAREIHASSR